MGGWLIRIMGLALLILPLWTLSPASVEKSSLAAISILIVCFVGVLGLGHHIRPNDVNLLAAGAA
jgi:hypothetical protein